MPRLLVRHVVNFGGVSWLSSETVILVKMSGKQEDKAKLTTGASKTRQWLTSGLEVNHSIAGRIATLQGVSKPAEFARKCGIRESLLRKYLAGSMPGVDKAAKIARANGVTLDWLATGEGSAAAGTGIADPGLSYGPAALNQALLSSVLREVQEALDRSRLRPGSGKHAELVALVYEHCLPAGEVQPGVIERFVKLIS